MAAAGTALRGVGVAPQNDTAATAGVQVPPFVAGRAEAEGAAPSAELAAVAVAAADGQDEVVRPLAAL